MSVSLLEVIEHGGYNITTYEDANWLLSKQNEFAELIEQAQEVVDSETEGCCGAGIDDFGYCKDCREHCK